MNLFCSSEYLLPKSCLVKKFSLSINQRTKVSCTGAQSRMGPPPSAQRPSAASPPQTNPESDLQSVQEQETEKLGGQP